jgi:NAD(P)H dehydrogenase (quinone)
MGKIIVTGASGHIGKHTFAPLLKRNPASNVIALVRDPTKADDLAALGIEIRKGDYFDYDSLVRAFEGIEKVMLVSAHAFTDRNTQHYNVITAARQAGVKHVVFMSINRKEGSGFTMPEVTPTDLFAEATLKASGLNYTIVRHPPFLDVIQFYIGDKAYERGVQMPPGDGKFTAVTREDLAEAHAVILSELGHENKTYTLTGYKPVSFADVAGILGKTRNVEVPYSFISDQDYIDRLTAKGFPLPLAEFVHLWVVGMSNGEWDEVTGDLETLLGRKPKAPTEFFSADYPAPAA